jgi:hypothetical protein
MLVLMAVILATWETEIRRQAQAKEIHEIPISGKKLGVMASAYHPSNGMKLKIGRSQSRLPGQK